MFEPADITLRCGEWEAHVASRFGMNALSLMHNGKPILRTPESEDVFLAAPEQYGTPPLMPALRTAFARFTFEGKTYTLVENDPTHHAHKHGLLHRSPFRVIEQTAQKAIGVLENTGEIFPFPFVCTISAELTHAGLRQSFAFLNTGGGNMPLVFALHTAFALPQTMRVPIGQKWAMDENIVPTGELLPLTDEEKALFAGCDAPSCMADGAFTALGSTAELGDYAYRVSPNFTQWVLWNGGGGKGFTCVEPMSGPANALNRADCLTLTAGESIRFDTEIGKVSADVRR